MSTKRTQEQQRRQDSLSYGIGSYENYVGFDDTYNKALQKSDNLVINRSDKSNKKISGDYKLSKDAINELDELKNVKSGRRNFTPKDPLDNPSSQDKLKNAEYFSPDAKGGKRRSKKRSRKSKRISKKQSKKRSRNSRRKRRQRR